MDEITRSTTGLATCGAVFAVSADAASSPTIVVSGELDMASAPYFDRFLSVHLTHGRGGLGLDLGEVSFFSAAGLRTLLGAAESAGRTGTALRVTALSATVEHFLELTGTRSYLDILCSDGPAAPLPD